MMTPLKNEIQCIPLVRLLVPFIIGILSVISWGIASRYDVIVIFLLLLVFLILNTKLHYHYRWAYGMLAVLLMLFLGRFIGSVHQPVSVSLNDKPDFITVLVEEYNPSSKKFDQLFCKIEESAAYPRLKGERLLLYLEGKKQERYFLPGDLLVCKVSLDSMQRKPNPFDFNYADYLKSRRIRYQAFVNSDSWMYIQASGRFMLKRKALSVRNDLLDRFFSVVSDENLRTVFSAMVLGQKKMMPDSLANTFRNAGMMHILAVSGLHVGILAFALKYVLLLLPFRKIRYLLLVILLWGYVFITGMSASVTRAVMMFSFLMWAWSGNRKGNSLNILAASAFVMLLWDSFMILQLGFQLSFFAVAGILLIVPSFNNRINDLPGIIRYPLSIMGVSFAAQVAVSPILFYYFHYVPLHAIFINVLVIPLASVLLISGFLLLIVADFALVSNGLVYFSEFVWKLMNLAMEIPASLHPDIFNIYIDKVGVLMLYLLIIPFFFFVIRKDKKAVLVFLFSLLGFSFFLLFKDIKKNKSNEAWIYHFADGACVDFVQGNKSLLLHLKQEEQIPDIEEWHFLNGRSAQAKNIKNKNMMNNAIFKLGSNHVLNINGLLVLWVHTKDKKVYKPLKDKIKLDVVLVSNNALELAGFEDVFDVDQLVLDASNDYYYEKKIRRACGQWVNDICMMREKGALKIQ